MSTLWWIAFWVILTIEVFSFALTFAPKPLWRRIDQRSSNLAASLWGFSHPFGPRLKVGETKPWYRED
ncbi:hypothetical protein SEA_YEET_66 [Mycobacterium phage Yeet]|uniref:Uncharacterized protein n=1 Tax=Mycobacterium phage Superphikiman TaxID=2041551 RepID=A0A2D2W4D0_9CAUD|nr:hypothetical protein [Acinetobacter baumannii]YP_008410223.1 hypothetical protein N860_gp065 [Mycobacterium phage Redno2]YP_009124027.1 hypothetical protein VC71_gp074 [Mycobacterium phage Minerva]ASD53459.1 hypothetical protein PBI_LUCKY2013_66 [Mycobacterium phage Lucky2013]ATN88876.1 hypothetical protein SEA_DMPSTRDIVER_67 [Mycobacterium phage DmpstrDiver]ATS92909.1 hypothetical protein SEA_SUPERPHIKIMAN_66 [Mycobacterium phage Superphikiman]AWH13881.1 hypothetical protein SEA_HALLEY_69